MRPSFGRVPLDCLTRHQALERIAALVAAGGGGTVFTPNVDHVILAEENAALREAYESVDVSLVDGMPVLWASRLFGLPVPEKVSGSDLIRPLMSLAGRRGWRVFLLGSGPGVAERAARLLCEETPGLQIVGTSSPRIDMTRPASDREDVRRELAEARPDLVLVALGPPKGEIFAHECRAALGSVVFVSIGAGLDFLVGVFRRAPPWMSACGLEWSYRLYQEPRRLWRRYLVRGPRFIPIAFRTALRRARSRAST